MCLFIVIGLNLVTFTVNFIVIPLMRSYVSAVVATGVQTIGNNFNS